jgi:hypothetical protein
MTLLTIAAFFLGALTARYLAYVLIEQVGGGTRSHFALVSTSVPNPRIGMSPRAIHTGDH